MCRRRIRFAKAPRDKWGGSKASTMPCYREKRKKGSCDDKACPFSHNPATFSEGKKKGKKGKSEKSDKKKKSKK
jgi:hypothetical protein